MEQLVFELKAGIRLPTPDNCPNAIAKLMQHCFSEQPLDRPSFGQIKESISIAYKDVTRFLTDNKLNTIREQDEVHYTDVGMEERYLDMQKQNQHFKELHKAGTNDNRLVRFDTRQSVDNYQNDELMYASLQNMNSGAPETNFLNIAQSEMLLSSINHPKMKKNEPLIDIHSPSYKRFYSYSDIEAPPTSVCNQHWSYNGLTAAKSYPNPYYMMSLANVDIKGPSAENLMDKKY